MDKSDFGAVLEIDNASEMLYRRFGNIDEEADFPTAGKGAGSREFRYENLIAALRTTQQQAGVSSEADSQVVWKISEQLESLEPRFREGGVTFETLNEYPLPPKSTSLRWMAKYSSEGFNTACTLFFPDRKIHPGPKWPSTERVDGMGKELSKSLAFARDEGYRPASGWYFIANPTSLLGMVELRKLPETGAPAWRPRRRS